MASVDSWQKNCTQLLLHPSCHQEQEGGGNELHPAWRCPRYRYLTSDLHFAFLYKSGKNQDNRSLAAASVFRDQVLIIPLKLVE